MANTNIDLIRDQLIEAVEECYRQNLFLDNSDYRTAMEDVYELTERFEWRLQEFKPVKSEQDKFEEMGGEYDLPQVLNNSTEYSDEQIALAASSVQGEAIIL